MTGDISVGEVTVVIHVTGRKSYLETLVGRIVGNAHIKRTFLIIIIPRINCSLPTVTSTNLKLCVGRASRD